jgi:hypothetical protein
MATIASPRNMLAAWLGGAAVGCVMPVGILLTLALPDHVVQAFSDVQVLGFFGRVFCVPAVGAATVGAGVGARRWRAAAVGLAISLVLMQWAFGDIRGKGEVIMVPFAVVNAVFAAFAAAHLVRRRTKV